MDARAVLAPRTKDLSVNNMLCYFPVDARVRATEKAIAESQTGLLGSIGRILAEGRMPTARPPRPQIATAVMPCRHNQCMSGNLWIVARRHRRQCQFDVGGDIVGILCRLI